MIDFIQIEDVVRDNYNKAKKNIEEIRKSFALSESVISNRIPGYEALELKFGAYEKDNFSVLFIDMKNSTKRAEVIGPEKTFLSMHAFIPGMLEVIKSYNGYVVDIMGDGIMVFFGGKESQLTKIEAAQNAGLCGIDMLRVLNQIVNKILGEDKIWNISCGIGVDYGNVIVTKIGINELYDVKAYGDCINKSAHYTKDVSNKVKISKAVHDLWPSGKNGKINFSICEDGNYIISNSI